MDRRLAILGLLGLISVVCVAGQVTPHPASKITPSPTNSTSEPTSTPAPSNSTTSETTSSTSSGTHSSSKTSSSTSSGTHSSSKTSSSTSSGTHSSSKTTSTTSSGTHSSSKTTSTSSSGTHSSTSSKTPHVTPTPAPAKPPTPEYVLRNKNGSDCIVLNATMDFIVAYNISSKDKNNKTVPIQKYLTVKLPKNATVTNNSYCQRDGTFKGDLTALLQLRWNCTKENKEKCQVDFKFTASSNDSKQQWTLDTTTVSISGDLFDKSAEDPINGTELVGNSYDVMDQELDYQRSYACNSVRNATTFVVNTSSVADYYTMTINVSQFQVQAFQFSNNTADFQDGFNQAASCPADNQDNKIVPIAVGAALAGLVIIVLIAYIIGRLRSRKQSSYEALS